jgi:ubiquitin-activating enzyme E1
MDRIVHIGLTGSTDEAKIRSILDDFMVPEFEPNSNVVIPANEAEAKKQKENAGEEEEDKVSRLLSELPAPSSLAGYRLIPIEFEKDDDTNFHIDFITNCSNLRATNYEIAIADRHKTKGIAGKIIPAMVTTTAMVTGLVCLELLKVIQKKKIEAYKNSFCNLALPLFTFSEPFPPEKVKVRDGWEWSLWDRFDFQGPKTLGEIIDEFEEKYKLEVSMMSGDSTLLYGFYMPPAKIAERRAMELSELYTSLTQKPLTSGTLTLVCCCSRMEDDEDVEVPSALYRFK